MKIQSYIRVGSELEPVTVELTLSPGLPQFHFIGLPDAALKESALRIRSAIREQGFKIPQTQQILVNFSPTHLRKTSEGLDLAIAAALLWETGQVPPLETPGLKPPTVYGELTLRGEVVAPRDLDELGGSDQVLTGVPLKPVQARTWRLQSLQDLLREPHWQSGEEALAWVRPGATVASFSREAAELAEIVAAGEHSILLAGPPGSGKSTLASSLPAWLAEPDPGEFSIARKYWRRAGLELSWRPVLKPHHSIPPLSMIGGGMSLYAGEITRAHGGVLVMDELLEFHPLIQEALREPVEAGLISLVRGGGVRTYPARLLLVATTNLCSCGKFVPDSNAGGCTCSRQKRQKVLKKLTGPFADRFALIQLTDQWSESERVASDVIGQRVKAAVDFRQARGQSVPNARLMPEAIEAGLSSFQMKHLISGGARSRRRRDAVVRVARTLADLRQSEVISNEDLERSLKLSVRVHRKLEEWVEN